MNSITDYILNYVPENFPPNMIAFVFETPNEDGSPSFDELFVLIENEKAELNSFKHNYELVGCRPSINFLKWK